MDYNNLEESLKKDLKKSFASNNEVHGSFIHELLISQSIMDDGYFISIRCNKQDTISIMKYLDKKYELEKSLAYYDDYNKYSEIIYRDLDKCVLTKMMIIAKICD